MSIGKYTYGTNNLIIHYSDSGSKLIIGNFCSIAGNINIFLGGNHRTDWVTTYPFGHINQHKFNNFNGEGHPGTKGDVIIGKILTKSNKNGDEEVFDCSYTIKSGEEGFIDRVIETVTPNGYKMIKVTIRNQRIPEIGDKVASRSAQKGTIGVILPQEDMPFTASGQTPDILINSLCIPR